MVMLASQTSGPTAYQDDEDEENQNAAAQQTAQVPTTQPIPQGVAGTLAPTGGPMPYTPATSVDPTLAGANGAAQSTANPQLPPATPTAGATYTPMPTSTPAPLGGAPPVGLSPTNLTNLIGSGYGNTPMPYTPPPFVGSTPSTLATSQQASGAQNYTWTDPTTGQSVTGTQPPVGVPAMASAGLVTNPDGSTSSTQATPTNSLAGWVGAQGGTFGGYTGPQTDPYATGAAAGLVNGQAVPTGQTADQDAATQMAQSAVQQQLSNQNMQSALANPTQAWWNSLSPAFQQQYLAQASGPMQATFQQLAQNAGGVQPIPQVFQAAGTDNNTGVQLSPTGGSVGGGTATPQSNNTQNQPPSTTPASPAAQVNAVSGMAPMNLSAVNSAPSLATTATSPSTTGATTGNASNVGTGNANQNDILSLLLGGANAQGAGSGVQNSTNTAIQNLLQNPSAYSLPQIQQIEQAQLGSLNQQYGALQKQLDEQDAARGIGASSIASGYEGDLLGQEANAKANLEANLINNAAQSAQTGLLSGINAGTNAANSTNANALNYINSAQQYGQNAYNNDLNTAYLNAQQQNNYQNYLLQLLGLGYSPTG